MSTNAKKNRKAEQRRLRAEGRTEEAAALYVPAAPKVPTGKHLTRRERQGKNREAKTLVTLAERLAGIARPLGGRRG